MSEDAGTSQQPAPGASPTRAELRRARELGLTTAALPGPTQPGSRADRRRAQERDERAPGFARTLVTAWWAYLLLVALVACVVLAVRSADQPVPQGPAVVVNPSDAGAT